MKTNAESTASRVGGSLFNLNNIVDLTHFNPCNPLISRLCTLLHVNENIFPTPPLPSRPSAKPALSCPAHPNSRQRSGLRRSHVALLSPSPIANRVAISRFSGQIKDTSGHIMLSPKTALTPPAKEFGFNTHINSHFKRTDNV